MLVKEPTSDDLKRRILELESEINGLKNNQSKIQIIEEENSNLLHSNRKFLFENILKTTPYTFVVKDKNSVYIEVNKSFCDFLGKKEEEIIGKTDYDFFPAKEAEEYIKGDKAVMAGGIHEKEEWEVLGSEGIKWLKVDKTVIYDSTDENEPIGILCSVTDISLQKTHEHSLAESGKKLLELNAMKDNIFSIIGHDLRTPIINIIGFSELLIENNELEKNEKFLKIILSSANKSLLLLSDLLEWSKSQSNQIQIYKESINLSKIISSTFDLSSDNIIEKEIKYNIICSEDLFVKTDKYILSTVIRNLLSNAVKFSNIGGSINIICSEIDINEGEKGVEIIVEDRGVGISLENLNTLFKFDKTITTKGTYGEVGTGLGLVLCKTFVDKIGGEIKVESEVGKGSKFIVTLN